MPDLSFILPERDYFPFPSLFLSLTGHCHLSTSSVKLSNGSLYPGLFVFSSPPSSSAMPGVTPSLLLLLVALLRMLVICPGWRQSAMKERALR